MGKEDGTGREEKEKAERAMSSAIDHLQLKFVRSLERKLRLLSRYRDAGILLLENLYTNY